MLFFFTFILLSYFFNLQSYTYYQDKEHLLELDYKNTLQYNVYYNDFKNLIYNAITFYYFNLIFNLNFIETTNILKGTFILFSLINLLKITHGIFYNKFKYFTWMIIEFTLLYIKFFHLNNNSFSADNIIFTNLYFLYLLLDM